MTSSSSSPTSLLWQSIEKNDRALLVNAIQSGADLNSVRADHTPLTRAVAGAVKANLSIVTTLLKAGADVDANVALCCAAARAIWLKNADALALLLAAGADPNVRSSLNSNGSGAVVPLLFIAVFRRAHRCASLLLAAGAEWRVEFAESAITAHEEFGATASKSIFSCQWIAILSCPLAAKRELEFVGVNQCRRRIFDVCVALQELELPAPLLIDIVLADCEPFALALPYFYLWNAVVKVKHFHTREHAPPLLRVVDLVKAAPFERSRVLSEFETALEEKWRAARALLEQDDTIGSAALFDEIFRVYHRLLGKNHALTAQATAALAQLRWNRGDLAGAESLLQEALASRRRALGERHMVTTETRRDLSELQRLLGRKEA